jgi:class 3 adenylate cyclase/pimeloyl-ACP methyl ester carboxylesterase
MDVLFMLGWISQVEHVWESPALRRFLERIGTFSRVILFDRRGTGLSERVPEAPSLEDEMDDAIAVLDAAGSERAALFAYALGGPSAALTAARRPERVAALLMYAAVARTTWAPDYDWAMTVEARTAGIEAMVADWGEAKRLPAFAPSAADDPAFIEWFARLERLASSPGAARVLSLATNDIDVRDVLPAIGVPSLVMHRPEEILWDVRHSRYLARCIPGARYVELPGSDSFPWMGDSDAVVDEIEEFLTGGRTGGGRERALLTVMFTDIVDATARAGDVGDRRWRDLLSAHDEIVRAELSRFGGSEVKTIGDSFLVTFDGLPTAALRCAQAIVTGVAALGVEVRVGLHTGECEQIGDDVAGMAVHIASRVNGLAGTGEVLVSGTVYGTVVGGPFRFEDRGFHELKGVPGRWPLFALRV